MNSSSLKYLGLDPFMLSDINLQVSMGSVILPSIINGIAISFIFVPLTTATMASQLSIGKRKSETRAASTISCAISAAASASRS